MSKDKYICNLNEYKGQYKISIGILKKHEQIDCDMWIFSKYNPLQIHFIDNYTYYGMFQRVRSVPPKNDITIPKYHIPNGTTKAILTKVKDNVYQIDFK